MSISPGSMPNLCWSKSYFQDAESFPSKTMNPKQFSQKWQFPYLWHPQAPALNELLKSNCSVEVSKQLLLKTVQNKKRSAFRSSISHISSLFSKGFCAYKVPYMMGFLFVWGPHLIVLRADRIWRTLWSAGIKSDAAVCKIRPLPHCTITPASSRSLVLALLCNVGRRVEPEIESLVAN